MAAPGDVYERELKNILSGDEKTIRKIMKGCLEDEADSYLSLVDHPFMVVRAAGSHGVDLIAMRWDYSFPIEVKSSVDDVMHFSRSPRLGEQAEWMRGECARSQLLAVYAMRYKKPSSNVKGDPWRLFCVPMGMRLRGSTGLLQRLIPELETGPSGNYIMTWEKGMKLSDFIRYANMDVE
jgi:Holliday junction resolvase